MAEKRTRRRYTAEFKAEAVKRLLDGGKGLSGVATELGLTAPETADLEMAALLHHLGQVTFEDPEVAGAPEPSEVAAVTSGMLRDIRPLAGAGEIVGGDGDDSGARLAAQVLRLASAYDDLTVVDGTRGDVAIELLRTEPGYVYDERVMRALERTVRSRIS